ncbi:hypothetical protein K402DRAFT_462365 [Aulographum hederae CBS 113979]|uniref:PLAC8-domain-containing protein n=1 Tax=Aulographum hederae CBS 113979 TaxID=1176131 RepID=A0A6G1H427_9PEZI|nr:hypothetical protein K402DRAFT_462365 [Aulographum hederae CBS 113979]
MASVGGYVTDPTVPVTTLWVDRHGIHTQTIPPPHLSSFSAPNLRNARSAQSMHHAASMYRSAQSLHPSASRHSIQSHRSHHTNEPIPEEPETPAGSSATNNETDLEAQHLESIPDTRASLVERQWLRPWWRVWGMTEWWRVWRWPNPSRAAIKSVLCPCCLFADVHDEIHVYDGESDSPCNTACTLCCCAGLGCWWGVVVGEARSAVRERYSIPGSAWLDCILGCVAPWCVLTECRTEIRQREIVKERQDYEMRTLRRTDEMRYERQSSEA